MEIFDKKSCIEKLTQLVEATTLTEEQRNEFMKNNDWEKIHLERRMIRTNDDYTKKREVSISNDKDGDNLYKIIGITDDGNLIIQYTGEIPWR